MLGLRVEFVEAICHVYVEKHKPYKFQKLLAAFQSRNPSTAPRGDEAQDPAGGPATKGSDDAAKEFTPKSTETIPPSAFVEEALSKCTLYELLNTHEGFLTLQSYFIKAAMLLDRYSTSNEQAGGQHLLDARNYFDPVSSTAYLELQTGLGGLTDQSRAAQQCQNLQAQHGSGCRNTGMLAPPFGYASTNNLLVLSTGGGMHNNPLHSNIMVEVDEFKFAKIIKSVIQKMTTSAATSASSQNAAAEAQVNNNLPQVQSLDKRRRSYGAGAVGSDDSSCSLSDMDYDDETEMSLEGGDDGANTALFPGAQSDEVNQADTSNLSWNEVKDLFSALDACNFETVGFREFCAHVFLLAAMQDNQLLQCLYQHGVLLFDILGGGQNLITAERAKEFGRTLMGLPEGIIDETCEQMFDLRQGSLVTFEEFQLVYFEIFKRIQLKGGKEVDFDHFEAVNTQVDNLLSERNKHHQHHGVVDQLNTEHTLFDEHEGDGSTYQLTSAGHRAQIHSQSQRHGKLSVTAADFKGRIGRISTTRRSLANLPSGGSSNLDPADISSPKNRQRDHHHHKRHSSRVDVISEKEELAAEENSLSQQEANESVESPPITLKITNFADESKKQQAANSQGQAGETGQTTTNRKKDISKGKKSTKVCCPKPCAIF